jgi:molecular chaperone GrpE
MSNPAGGRQPWRVGGEPPQVQHDFGAETGPPDTGPPGTGRTDGGGGAGGAATVADLEARLAGLQARLAEAEDQKLRAAADLDNYRKRCAAQVERAEADARAQVARQWLPVVDNLERALEHAAADPRTIVEGIQAVRQLALGVLASLGFPRRDDTGARFDPARHEAVATTSDPRVSPGTVVQVVRPGYGEPDRLLRPAQVIVAKAD